MLDVIIVCCLGQQSKHPFDVVITKMVNSVPAGTDITKPEEGTMGAQKRKRRDGSADPPNRVHVSREGDTSADPPRAQVSVPLEPPAFTGFHHGHAIQNEDSFVGSLVTGRVDSKIDCGYFVSININGYTFQGRGVAKPHETELH